MSGDCPQLVRAYLDGTASDDEVLALDRMLRDDAALRSAMLGEAAFDVHLRMALQRAQPELGKLPAAVRLPARRRQRMVWGLVAAAAGIALVVGSMWWRWGRQAAPAMLGKDVALTQTNSQVTAMQLVEPVARVVSVRGIARLSGGGFGEGLQVGAEGADIGPDAVLDVARHGVARVAYPDGSRLTIHGGGRVVFPASGSGKTLQVDEGAVDAVVCPQPPDLPMVVYTARLTVRVAGTEFRVITDKAASWVAVRSGRVRVFRHSDGSRLDLASGRYATVNPKVPFGSIPAKTCPVWQGQCQLTVGDRYP